MKPKIVTKHWPDAGTVRKVIRHLEDDLGLSIYGNVYHPETGWEGPPCGDYDAEKVLKYRQDLRTGRLWNDDDSRDGA